MKNFWTREKKLRAFAPNFFFPELQSGARMEVDHRGPGAGSTGPPQWRGVVQTESARNRLKRTLRGSDRRSAEVGSGVDQWTTPWRIFLLAAGPDLGEPPRVGGPPRLSGAVAVGECGGDDDTYFKKEKGWSTGPVQLDHPGSRRRVAESHFQAIRARRALDHPPWSKVVQGGPAWSRVVQTVQSEFTPRRASLR